MHLLHQSTINTIKLTDLNIFYSVLQCISMMEACSLAHLLSFSACSISFGLSTMQLSRPLEFLMVNNKTWRKAPGIWEDFKHLQVLSIYQITSSNIIRFHQISSNSQQCFNVLILHIVIWLYVHFVHVPGLYTYFLLIVTCSWSYHVLTLPFLAE